MPWINTPKVNGRGVPTGEYRREYQPPDMRGWEQLARDVEAPGPVAVALSTGRPELIPDKYNWQAGEADRLAAVIKVLMETNRELQEHSEYLAQRLDEVSELLEGASRKVGRVIDVANFRQEGDDDDADE